MLFPSCRQKYCLNSCTTELLNSYKFYYIPLHETTPHYTHPIPIVHSYDTVSM